MLVSMNLCKFSRAWIFAVLTIGVGNAKEDFDPTPQTPTAFETRNAGDATEGTAEFGKEKGKKIKLQFIALTDSREWHDKNEKPTQARLLAFEEDEGFEGTVIREGKVRLLVDGAKLFSLLPVSKLSERDQEFVLNLAAEQKKGETTSERRQAGSSNCPS